MNEKITIFQNSKKHVLSTCELFPNKFHNILLAL